MNSTPTKRIRIPDDYEKCPKCDGRGILTLGRGDFFRFFFHDFVRCPMCLGKGVIKKRKEK